MSKPITGWHEFVPGTICNVKMCARCDEPYDNPVHHTGIPKEEPPTGHNPALTGPNAFRQAKAQILPPPVPEGATVNNETDVIRVWSLPDEHCEDCHHPQGNLSCVAVGERLITVCCTVTENFKRATGQL